MYVCGLLSYTCIAYTGASVVLNTVFTLLNITGQLLMVEAQSWVGNSELLAAMLTCQSQLSIGTGARLKKQYDGS